MARRWFRKTTFDVKCSDETHTITLMPSGRLKLNDHNLETVRAFMAFGAKRPACLEVYESWYKGGVVFPDALASELFRVREKLTKIGLEALKRGWYREPSDRLVDRAGIHYVVNATALPGGEHITSEVKTVWHSKFGKRHYPGNLLRIMLVTSIPGYIEVLKYIPTGVAYTKDGRAIAVASINKVRRVKRKVDALEATVGKQGRRLSIESASALLRRDDEGDWVVRKWL